MAEAFDTLSAAEKLQNGGLSDDQSRAIAYVIGDANTGRGASKEDLEKLKNELKLDIKEVETKVERFRNQIFIALGVLFLALIAVLKDWSQIFS